MKYIAQLTPPLYTMCPVLPFSTVYVVTHTSTWSRVVYMVKQVSCGRVKSKPRPSLLLLLLSVLGKTTKEKEEKERGEGYHELTPWILAKLIVSHPRCAQVFLFVCFQSHELFVCLMLSLFIACLYGATLLLCLTYQHLFARQTERVKERVKEGVFDSSSVCLASFCRSDLACIEAESKGETEKEREREGGWERTNPSAEPAFTTAAEKKIYIYIYYIFQCLRYAESSTWISWETLGVSPQPHHYFQYTNALIIYIDCCL